MTTAAARGSIITASRIAIGSGGVVVGVAMAAAAAAAAAATRSRRCRGHRFYCGWHSSAGWST